MDQFYLIFSPNKSSDRKTDRQTLNCRMATLLTMIPPEKEDLSKKKKI